ncbi:MAG: hypothetical protein IKC09_04585 [Oscillospiraceae bacterium]|nr:hypothetical protein [Oscillospiraceae bacterium]
MKTKFSPLLILLCITLALAACTAEPGPIVLPSSSPTDPSTVPVTDPPAVPSTGSPATPTQEATEAPTEGKILLKLRFFDTEENPEYYETTQAETESKTLLLQDLNLPETGLKTYENDSFLGPIAEYLEEAMSLKLDGKWKYYIHYYTPEQDQGVLALTYWIGDAIATNRAVTFPIENGAIHTVIYSYLGRTADEAELLQKYSRFQNTYEQERTNILGDGFEIYGESTLYVYNYRTDQLTYSYNIFYRHIETGIIDNSYGTEMVIESGSPISD